MNGADAVASIAEPQSAQGWACTPTTEPTQTSKQRIKIKIVGNWQQTFLYAILSMLMILIFINIGLTLWIISSLKLTMNKIGPIKINKGGIVLEGQAIVTDRLIASSINSRTAQPLTMHSYRNFSILVSGPDQTEFSKLLIKKNSLQFSGKSVVFTDSKGKEIFKASAEEVAIAADALNLRGSGGVSVRSALQTAAVTAPPGSDLQLESQTRRLDLQAPQLIQLESRAGSIDVISHADIKIDSVVGAIKFDAQNIYIHKLREAVPKPINANTTRSRTEKPLKVYQLCACASGKLFLAPSDGLCVAQHDDNELCR